jgi:hypothetical protein
MTPKPQAKEAKIISGIYQTKKLLLRKGTINKMKWNVVIS